MDPFAGTPAVLAPLVARFGERLALTRDADGVSWSFDGRIATVTPRAGGFLAASFLDRPAADARSAAPVGAVYAPPGGGYALAAGGCARMVDDMLAFFAGVREPRFTFVGLAPAARF